VEKKETVEIAHKRRLSPERFGPGKRIRAPIGNDGAATRKGKLSSQEAKLKKRSSASKCNFGSGGKIVILCKVRGPRTDTDGSKTGKKIIRKHKTHANGKNVY